MYEKSVLENGLRIITSTMPHTRSVAISVFVGAGSRYETDELAGVSHFLEHLLFKGTTLRPTPRDIAEAIEGVGGVINGATDKELTMYWVKVPIQHFALAMDVLFDALLHSRLDAEDVEKERAVISEEIAMIEDNPSDLVGVLIDEVLWPNHPLGREIAGTRESVSWLTQEQLRAYLQRQYVPANCVLAVAGNISHQQVVDTTRRLTAAWPSAEPATWLPARNGQTQPRLSLRSKRTEQGQLSLAVPAYPADHPDRYALDILNTILGEGMSSRLFLEIRERLGLAYDVQSYVNYLQDAGALVIAAGVDPKRIGPAIEASLAELARLKDGVPESELVKAREFMKGRLLLRMEDTRAVASWLGGQELLHREILTPDEVIARLDAVAQDDLRRVANDLFRTEKLNLAVVGPYRGEGRFQRLLRV